MAATLQILLPSLMRAMREVSGLALDPKTEQLFENLKIEFRDAKDLPGRQAEVLLNNGQVTVIIAIDPSLTGHKVLFAALGAFAHERGHLFGTRLFQQKGLGED